MGKSGKSKKSSSSCRDDQSAAEAEELLKEAEQLLEDEKPKDALELLEQVISLLPTNQTAWYHRGVAAAELCQALGDDGRAAARKELQREELRHTASESFKHVLKLDTSKRSEARYLSLIALARFLADAAEEKAEAEDLESGAEGKSVILVDLWIKEALERFEEAQALQVKWGHEAFDSDVWGSWGEALALQLRRRVKSLGSQSWKEWSLDKQNLELAAIIELRGRASECFSNAVAAEVEAPETVEDLRWLTVHAEHLLQFIEFMCDALIPEKGLAPELAETSWSQSQAAWCEALSIADDSAQLSANSETVPWEPLALLGDVFAAGVTLLSKVPEKSVLDLPKIAAIPDNPEEGLELQCVESSPFWLRHSEHIVKEAGQQMISLSCSKDEVGVYAAKAYNEALLCGGTSATPQVGLALGDLHLDLGRLALESSEIQVRQLTLAAEAYQRVLACKGSDVDDRVAAWYNLACVAALLSKPEKVTLALQSCLKACRGGNRKKEILKEARDDIDLIRMLDHPEVAALFEGLS
eukprot:TRINITY_DN27798_c0_g1_i1.p1 TRINITY_DN27798_c0_g1~~TRINITY_DN27798_c0_g1_i1.p1  ORF type:complete len:528 (+),score=131.29 TRINITY_DN27798_c0_g1_i1:105-1688(+)